MASLFKRRKPGEASPFWWVKFRDPITARIKRESTGFRVGVGADTRRAEQLRAEYTLRETQSPSKAHGEEWDVWVTALLKLRYANSPRTLSRIETAWRTLRMFLREKSILAPRQFTREHCFEYMAWRQTPDKRIGKYRAGHNTAHLEIKFLALIMKEAVLRKYAPHNPCRDLEIGRAAIKEKPELTPAAVELIRARIQTEPEPARTFFNNSFEIAFYHGVRLTGTHLDPLRDVYQTAAGQWRITFTHKGKTRAKILHPKLIPIFEELRAAGKSETYPRQKNPSRQWFNFLTRHGLKQMLPGVCFHSTRVTVATTLARKGVSEKKAKDYVDHASTTIHRSYVRLQPDDLQECTDAIV